MAFGELLKLKIMLDTWAITTSLIHVLCDQSIDKDKNWSQSAVTQVNLFILNNCCLQVKV